MCSGKGLCRRNICICNQGWAGEGCQQVSSKALPSVLEDHFGGSGQTKALPKGGSTSRWKHSSGGMVSDICGPMPSGTALHFYGECSRVLESIDLDLSGGSWIQFWFRVGCLASDRVGAHRLADVYSEGSSAGHMTRNKDVLLQYSLDAGIHWTTFLVMRTDRPYRTTEPRLWSAAIPLAARVQGVRFRWWQPLHGGRAKDDWAIDAIRIGNTQLAPEVYYSYEPRNLIGIPQQNSTHFIDFHLKMASDSPTSVSTMSLKDGGYWLRQDNVRENMCGDIDSLVGQATTVEEAILETFDVPVKTDFVLQFQLWVGCNSTNVHWNEASVSLEVSLDKGQSWELLDKPCHPRKQGCAGQPSIPSKFYYGANHKWRRFVFPLGRANDREEDSQVARFRWRQLTSESAPPWSVQELYIGPSCPEHCHGNGRCTPAGCTCTDMDCRPASQLLPKGLRYGFGGTPLLWDTILGASNGADTSTGIRFDDQGLRLAESQDLDLRGARFILFILRLDRTPDISDINSIYLQFSPNKGITWSTLAWYTPGTSTLVEEYLELPQEALVEQVRFRWWQLASFAHNGMIYEEKAPRWSLSRLIVGGDAINPAFTFQDFSADDTLQETFWSWTGADIRSDFCSSSIPALVWDGKTAVSEGIVGELTTRQLIVDADFIIQFKIIVNCGTQDQCTKRGKVNLMYTTDYANGRWSLVEEPCFPSTLSGEHLSEFVEKDRKANVFCSPFRFHTGTTYTADGYSSWTRITLLLPERMNSGQTQFRWISDNPQMSWGISYLYIGEACPGLCSGRGDCREGKCHCDPGRTGADCRQRISSHYELSPPVEDLFESGSVLGPLWELVHGGKIVSSVVPGVACGPLLTSSGRGGRLYFDGCGLREAVTRELDTSQAGKVSYILRIGSREGRWDCHIVGLSNGSAALQNKGVLLQYTLDEGIRWVTLTSHPPQAFLQAQSVSLELPVESRVLGVRFRWWQPFHGGKGHDQWVIDEVKISSSGNLHQDPWRNYGHRFQG